MIRRNKKISDKEMFKFYIIELENDIIKEIAKKKRIANSKAMDIYYKSRFSNLLEVNKENMAFLDYRYLANIILNK